MFCEVYNKYQTGKSRWKTISPLLTKTSQQYKQSTDVLNVFEVGKKRKQSTGGVLHEKMFLKILQNLRENTCDRVPFLIKLQASAWHR